MVGICECVRGAGRTLTKPAAQLAIATKPGHFNRHPWQWQSSVAKDEQTFADTDHQCVSLGEYPRFNSANGWIVYE